MNTTKDDYKKYKLFQKKYNLNYIYTPHDKKGAETILGTLANKENTSIFNKKDYYYVVSKLNKDWDKFNNIEGMIIYK